MNLFQLGSKESIMLPEPVGPVIQMTEKLYVPVKDHPEFNFVGRILGPRGMTAKQLEQEIGTNMAKDVELHLIEEMRSKQERIEKNMKYKKELVA